MRTSTWILLSGALLLVAASAQAQFTPQTIVVDGVNDFAANNLVEDDGLDTEQFCDPLASPLDIGEVYVTNDANNLYIGFSYDRACFADPAINLGIAFDVNQTADGADTDPFARQISWATAPFKPDFAVYSVLNTFNFEVFYQWNTGTMMWDDVTSTINPAGSGSEALPWVNDTGFEELSIPLTALGVTAADQLCIELWVTQDQPQKGPLECVINDDVQTSTPGGTVFDPPSPVELDDLFCYTVQSAVDNVPPVVDEVCKIGPGLVSVIFSEPVDETLAEDPFNYSLTNTAEFIINAERQNGTPNIVNLTLTGDIGSSDDFYELTVVNIEDTAGNAIIENGTDNFGAFFLKDLQFLLNAACFLELNGSGSDLFYVEGNTSPLNFLPCDDDAMTETAPGSGNYERTVEFCMPRDSGATEAELTIEYKYTWDDGTPNCQFETIGNRQLTFSSTSGGFSQIADYWDDNLPEQLLTKDVDVIFSVDMSAVNPGAAAVELFGNQTPLSFDSGMGTLMLDDGVFPDETAGDEIYTVAVSFLECTFKFLNYKFGLDGVFECEMQGDRNIIIAEAFGTIGSPEGPQVLDTVTYDFCTVTEQAVTVRFRVDASAAGAITTMELSGNRFPLSFDPPYTAMADDGIAPDETAGDDIYTVEVEFPAGTDRFVEYKYLADGAFECQGLDNRNFFIDESFAGSVQILDIDVYDDCGVPVSVDDVVPVPSSRALVVGDAYPNPFNPFVSLSFDVADAGRARVRVFDAGGRMVRQLLTGTIDAGSHTLVWDGRDAAGQPAASGVYFFRVDAAGQQIVRKMTLLE